MITHDEFQKALKIVKEYKTQVETHLKEVEKKIEKTKIELDMLSKFSNVNKDMKISQTYISQSLLNILNYNDDYFEIDFDFDTKISELSKISITKFLRCQKAGKMRLQELKELCFYAGVSLQP